MRSCQDSASPACRAGSMTAPSPHLSGQLSTPPENGTVPEHGSVALPVVTADRIDANGTVTLRAHGRLRHIGIGRAHAGTHVLLLIQDLHIRIINAATGDLLRELTLDPGPRLLAHRPTPRPAPGPARQAKTPNPDVRPGSFLCPETSHGLPR